jgi:hypothetical protein
VEGAANIEVGTDSAGADRRGHDFMQVAIVSIGMLLAQQAATIAMLAAIAAERIPCDQVPVRNSW